MTWLYNMLNLLENMSIYDVTHLDSKSVHVPESVYQVLPIVDEEEPEDEGG